MKNPFRSYKTSPEIIRLTVMMYARFPLLLRQVKILFTNAASMLATKRFAHAGTDLAQWLQRRLENVGFKAALIFSQNDETIWFSICIGDG
jgi:hypothetical protein